MRAIVVRELDAQFDGGSGERIAHGHFAIARIEGKYLALAFALRRTGEHVHADREDLVAVQESLDRGVIVGPHVLERGLDAVAIELRPFIEINLYRPTAAIDAEGHLIEDGVDAADDTAHNGAVTGRCKGHWGKETGVHSWICCAEVGCRRCGRCHVGRGRRWTGSALRIRIRQRPGR